jgi:2-oxoglutarate ferredoxin oxidoreductase subunit alpha
VVCELNSGQFASILKIKFSSFEFLQFNKIQGLPFANDDLIQKFKELV